MQRHVLFLALLGCLAAVSACKSEDEFVGAEWVRARVQLDGDCVRLTSGNNTVVVVQTDGIDIGPTSRWHRANRKVWVRLGPPEGIVKSACVDDVTRAVRLLEIKER